MFNLPQKDYFLPSSTVKRYKKKLGKVGIVDDSYKTIKADLEGIKDRVRMMDLAYDSSGVFMEKAILAMRLLTYGNTNKDLNKDDLSALLVPYHDLNALIDTTQFTRDTEGIDFIFLAMPYCINVIDEYKINNEKEYRRILREVCIAQGNLSSAMVGLALTLGYCLYQYDMEPLKEKLTDDIIDYLEKSSPFIKDMIEKSMKLFRQTTDGYVHKFGISMSILLNGTNRGEIDDSVAANFISYMRSEAIRLGHKDDFIKFIDGEDFPQFVTAMTNIYTRREEQDDK